MQFFNVQSSLIERRRKKIYQSQKSHKTGKQ